MKRSDIEKLIENIIDANIESSSEEMASIILYELLEAGMLPPGYMKPLPFESDGKQYPLIPGDFKNNLGVWCTPGINEWESEDE
jgi:hypothetical protein